MQRLDENEFSIRLVSEATETEGPKCQIQLHGEAAGPILEGAIFEAAIKYQEFYLLFTSNDCPYEESLNIYYLDSDLTILDQAILSWPYGTGLFKLLDIIEPNRIAFEFFTKEAWEITLYPKPHWSIPFFSEPRGVWRKFKFNRYFRISK